MRVSSVSAKELRIKSRESILKGAAKAWISGTKKPVTLNKLKFLEKKMTMPDA
jgi:hypothetical protein